MKKYRVRIGFGLEYEHATIFFRVNTRWEAIRERNGYIRLCRDNVFIDVTREQIRNYMVELKEQK